MSKTIAILGSTGSIGESALKVISKFNGDFRVAGLTTRRNILRLEQQVKKFRPSMVGVVESASFQDFSRSHGNNGLQIFGGTESLEKIATAPRVDLVLSGVVGAVGLKALLAALKMGRTVALANKESLIMAGSLVTETAKKYGATLLPVDSEHSAMFQCIQGQAGNPIHKIILTASGGPFYNFKGDLSKVTVEKALAHPNWVMGRKITVDSATLMNKGLEAIEAHFLFGVPLEKIQIVIHRQSIIHSAVEFEDGSILAQMSHPDMCLPIQYALTYPERKPCPIPRLDFAKMKQLDFAEPDFRKFPCLELALSAGKAGGTAPCVLSAANEVAVYAFLAGKIKFTDIPKIVARVLGKHKIIKKPGLEDILDADRGARREAEALC
ncbi:MAG: 1-deoxy-D-xylulose-5-phosphate reductoisomerase [Elusimicrobia bacterium RIFCSPLOWO2_01_FULL_54_10]|nr:MAG: 1-deoxy-D-xylulose-5-phosphate reductoisomerase [Elusimicrobia bacterium RIFCSPLOWO2_01_FULL_54_10]